MPEFERIVDTEHARSRMRRISEPEVERGLRYGVGRPDRRGRYIYELDSTRVIVVETEAIARVVTVVKLREK